MDFLSHSFLSSSLKFVQSEVRSLINQSFPVLILGARGTGKTSWAISLAKAKGTYSIVEANLAPKNIKDWRVLLLQSGSAGFVFEDIERWTEATQNSLAHFFKDNSRIEKFVISTSAPDLNLRVTEGQFRNDLYHRLSVRPLRLPEVRQCEEDIESAAQFWLSVHSLVSGMKNPHLTPEALKKLKDSRWPGEWSEFVTVLERAVSYGNEKIIPDNLMFLSWPQSQSDLQAGLTLAEMEKKLILQTLKLTAANKSQAARLLGISIRTLRNKLNEYKREGFHELI